MSTTHRHHEYGNDPIECAICCERAAHRTTRQQEFDYRDGRREIPLVALVPVIECMACGEIYTDQGAEEAQHDAVCRHLGRLTPDEIRMLRGRLGVTQAKLASLTGIGIASIKRWEAGSLIQNASLDARLRSLEVGSSATVPANVSYGFRFPPLPDACEAARRWRLRTPRDVTGRMDERKAA